MEAVYLALGSVDTLDELVEDVVVALVGSLMDDTSVLQEVIVDVGSDNRSSTVEHDSNEFA